MNEDVEEVGGMIQEGGLGRVEVVDDNKQWNFKDTLFITQLYYLT